jgi:hypothetical protein
VSDQREETAKNTIVRTRYLTSECKQLSDISAQTYERLVEDLELRNMEAQLQEVQQQEFFMEAHMKLLTAIEIMKRYQKQCAVQKQITAL